MTAAPTTLNGVRVERFPAWHQIPAGGELGVRCGDVIYVSDVQILRIEMGEPIAVLDVSEYTRYDNRPLR